MKKTLKIYLGYKVAIHSFIFLKNLFNNQKVVTPKGGMDFMNTSKERRIGRFHYVYDAKRDVHYLGDENNNWATFKKVRGLSENMGTFAAAYFWKHIVVDHEWANDHLKNETLCAQFMGVLMHEKCHTRQPQWLLALQIPFITRILEAHADMAAQKAGYGPETYKAVLHFRETSGLAFIDDRFALILGSHPPMFIRDRILNR